MKESRGVGGSAHGKMKKISQNNLRGSKSHPRNPIRGGERRKIKAEE